MLLFVLALTLFCGSFAAEDKRCRCVCPQLKTISELNSTILFPDDIDYTTKRIYTKSNVEAEDCLCQYIVNRTLPVQISVNIEDLGSFCLRCQCQFEQRNSTTQKVVVIFVIVVFGLMLVYGLFLLVLDPIMNKRRNQYQTQVNERSPQPRSTESLPSGSSGRVSQAVHRVGSRVREEQEKWRGNVTEQRRNIYTRHKILA